MSSALAGRVAVITGAGSGIGRAIASACAGAGAGVMLNDIDADGETVAAGLRELGANASFYQADVADELGMAALAAATLRRYGRIDILCANAGIFPRDRIEEMSLASWNRVIGVNLTGVFLAVRACLPAMRRQKYGRIVVTGSITGARVGQPGFGHYGASKAGLVGFVRCLALEVADVGINANIVEPGNIRSHRPDTDPAILAANAANIPVGRLGEPREVADAVVYLASEHAAFITGQTLVVDGGQTLPESALR